ncbi:MAG TPA: Arm DNA-binding domain-containing protein [Sphingopyxis sp.]|uniref:Arm DNA-binding domain-containing protein n=1 Tax=Sphingopyxis sp. TaxID=1908224 RepID=UPI002E0DF069|nr:Arm DNA-binding domain-containing protein [Sphingopyxis sp.]
MLTNLALKALKPEPKPYKKSDGGGLFILVEANGSKLWRFTYRHKGKQKLLSGGRFPQVSLVEARAWREMMKHQLALGLDPSEERRKEAEATSVGEGSSFEDVAREWLEARMLS